MSTFMSAMQASTPTTANGAITNASSGNRCTDLFFQIGSSRGKDLSTQFRAAYNENPNWAIRIVQWARDVRGGAGEREQFISLLNVLTTIDKEVAALVLMNAPEIGRYKDVVSMIRTDIGDVATSIMANAILVHKNALAAKWAPRKGPEAARLAIAFGMTAKEYRKTIVGLSNTVEQDMCARRWDAIDFSKLPSVASARYQKAFLKNANERYSKYLESLENGETTINAGAVYPYDIVKSTKFGSSVAADAQWKAQPDYMEGSTENVIAMVDVSGSMGCGTAVNGLSCMDVATSLGLYIAERTLGVFKDQFITFADNPSFVQVTGNDLKTKIRNMERADWGGSTNFAGAFKIILDRAIAGNVSQADMPTKMIVLSDMEFNQAECGYRGNSNTNFEAIKQLYADSGYIAPQLIFWNLNARGGNSPVTIDDTGTALISGFSPAIMKSVLSCSNMSPVELMLNAIIQDRYVGL